MDNESSVRALASRDRVKLKKAQAEIRALEQRLNLLERSMERRAARLARRLLRIGAPKLALPQAAPTPAAAVKPTRGLALVIDNQWPQPDRDSGSIDIYNLVVALERLGFDTILAATQQHTGEQPARDWLIAQNIACLQPQQAISVDAFIKQQGHTLDLCVLCRAFAGGAALEELQRSARQARLIFNTVDLNYVREERRALLLDDETLRANLPFLRNREEHIIGECDATLVVSAQEKQILAETIPHSYVIEMPLARALQTPDASFTQRSGIGFIGGFAHAPNTDGVRFFLKEVWPQVQSALPDCIFSIVGAGAPADLAGNSVNVRILGHVPDIKPWFESLRLTVAPLRFGAGAKGKVASSVAHGVPCIVTSVAAEGMSFAGQDGVVIADTPADFAAAIISAYTDEARWNRLSAAGLAYATKRLSLSAWQDRLEDVLGRLGL